MDREGRLEDSPDAAAQALLGILLSRHPGLVHVDELVRELSQGPEHHRLSEPAIRDGAADLVGDGLAHRVDHFLIASRAAVRAIALWS